MKISRGSRAFAVSIALFACAIELHPATAFAQASAGTRTTLDGRQILVSKDVGGERWAISVNLNDGTVTGNVFSATGGPPKFVWCDRTGDDGSLDAVGGQIRYSCRGSEVCTEAPCADTKWTELAQVSLPGSFFLPATDPFSTLRTPEHFCDDTCHLPEAIAGEDSYSLKSGCCNFVTLAQRTIRPIRVGDQILIRLWHFALTSSRNGKAYLAIQIGDRLVWDARLPIPCRGGLVGSVANGDCTDNPTPADVDPAEFVADFDAPAGSVIYLHIQNHGENSYNLVETSAAGLTIIDVNGWQPVSRGLRIPRSRLGTTGTTGTSTAAMAESVQIRPITRQ